MINKCEMDSNIIHIKQCFFFVFFLQSAFSVFLIGGMETHEECH